jgi:hypothetical protein
MPDPVPPEGIVRIKQTLTWKTAILFVRYQGVWRRAIPFVKENGQWKQVN